MGPGARQLLDQVGDALRGREHVRGTGIVEKVIPTTPDNVERRRIDRLVRKIIVDLFAEVIDRDRGDRRRERALDWR